MSVLILKCGLGYWAQSESKQQRDYFAGKLKNKISTKFTKTSFLDCFSQIILTSQARKNVLQKLQNL